MEHYDNERPIDTLIGKTILSVIRTKNDDELIFACDDGSVYKMHHDQDCCESVYIEDICGDLNDLIGSPIVRAEESSSDKKPEGVTVEYADSSFTWTFYRIATAKGLVVIRWYGTSNGYYSESVSFIEVA